MDFTKKSPRNQAIIKQKRLTRKRKPRITLGRRLRNGLWTGLTMLAGPAYFSLALQWWPVEWVLGGFVVWSLVWWQLVSTLRSRLRF